MNRDALKEVMRALVHGVYALGAGHGESGHLVTVSWAMQVSIEPPMVAVALHRESRAATLVASDLGFTLSPLSAEERALASRLGRPAAPSSKLTGVPLEPSPLLAIPLPTSAPGWLECRVSGRVDAGDHVVFVGEVLDAGSRRASPTMTLVETGWKYGS